MPSTSVISEAVACLLDRRYGNAICSQTLDYRRHFWKCVWRCRLCMQIMHVKCIHDHRDVCIMQINCKPFTVNMFPRFFAPHFNLRRSRVSSTTHVECHYNEQWWRRLAAPDVLTSSCLCYEVSSTSRSVTSLRVAVGGFALRNFRPKLS